MSSRRIRQGTEGADNMTIAGAEKEGSFLECPVSIDQEIPLAGMWLPRSVTFALVGAMTNLNLSSSRRARGSESRSGSG